MLKDYNHKEREAFWQQKWKEDRVNEFKNDQPREKTFVIDTPPPTVSGLLHMGHVFSYTQADFIARFKRMNGFDVFYPMGFDDNGLPTERLVEKVVGKRARAYDQENVAGAFIKKCHEVVDEAEEEFEEFFNSIALSVDWSKKYQTISKKVEEISQKSFLDLYHKGLVERKAEPVLWDMADATALSQADLVDKEVPSSMNEVEFVCEGKKFCIATTRPELIPACVAVMVNPDDSRYSDFVGKTAQFELFGVKVPVIADELVKLDKGTGAVMCCTFGDETDIKWWKKHSLALKLMLTKYGKIADVSWMSANETYKEIIGLNVSAARQKMISILSEKGFLKKSDQITHSVKCAERSGSAIEILVEYQWFIKILDQREELKKKVEECGWHPGFMKHRLIQWIDGLCWDWCISRQRFFGIRFPIWYSKRAGEEGKALIADISQLPCDPSEALPKGYSRGEVEPETDVMDTWATSSITPQISAGAINLEGADDKDLYQKLFPADLRPQAHEIIRTWAFYTIVKSLFHSNSVPWKNLMISGWCLASDKTKMSKSKGNTITPTALIKEKGSDVVRYFASTAALGADTAFSEEILKIGQRLQTKLFNASKFAAINLETLLKKNIIPSTAANDAQNGSVFCKSDLWILSKLSNVVKSATESFESFEYSRAREVVEEFFWKDFCDNYLEIAKVRMYGAEGDKFKDVPLSDAQKAALEKEQISGCIAIYHCLKTLLKLFAPFLPHITEEIHQELFKESVHKRGSWPAASDFSYDNEAFCEIEEVVYMLYEVRKFKSDSKLSMKVPVKVISASVPVALSNDSINDFRNVCNSNGANILKGERSQVIVELEQLV